MHVVRGIAGLELVEDPQPLLGERERAGLVRVPPRNGRSLIAALLRQLSGHHRGQFRHGGTVEERFGRQLDLELTAQP